MPTAQVTDWLASTKKQLPQDVRYLPSHLSRQEGPAVKQDLPQLQQYLRFSGVADVIQPISSLASPLLHQR